MPRILKLLLPLALFLGLPLLLDERVQPSHTPSPGGGARPAADRRQISGYRYTHYDPGSGARVFDLAGDRAVEEPRPEGSRQERFSLEGLTVILAGQAGRAAAFTPLTLTAPGGAVRFGRGGDTLVNIDGGVRAEAADGTVLTTKQVRITVGEERGTLLEARAPSAIRVAGPGLMLDAASGTYTPEGGWVLDGPCTGTLSQRDTGDPSATAELQRSVLGLHAPQGLTLKPAAEKGEYSIFANGGLFVDRRAKAGAPVQTFLGGDVAEIQLAGGGVTAIRVRNRLRAASIEPDGRCSAVVAAAAGEWDPLARTLSLTGRPRWYLRSGATPWIPGETSPDPLPMQPLAPTEVPQGWMASAQRSMTAQRDEAGKTVQLGLRDQAQLAAVRLTEAHPATRALAPIPEAVRRDPLAIAAYLVNRNLQDTAGEADAIVEANAIDAEVHPRDGDRQVIDFDASKQVRVVSPSHQDLLASAGRARGRFSTERTVRSVAAELLEKPEARVRPEPGRVVQLRPDGADTRILVEGRSAGTQQEFSAEGVDGVKLFDLRGEKVAAEWRADQAKVTAKRGEGEPEVLTLDAKGDVRASLPAASGGGERAEVALDRLTVARMTEANGEGVEGWEWAGGRRVQVPAATTFDVAGSGSLPGDPGARWLLQSKTGTLYRRLRQAGGRWVPVSSSVQLGGPATLTLKPAVGASEGAGFEAGATRLIELNFDHEPGATPGSIQTRLRDALLADDVVVRSRNARLEAGAISVTHKDHLRVWELMGGAKGDSRASALFRADGELPLTTRRIPGGKQSGEAASWYDARAKTIELTQTFTDATCTTLVKQSAKLSGSPAIGQRPAGGEQHDPQGRMEWLLRSTEPMHLETEGKRSVLRAAGGVELLNYDKLGNEQARLTAPDVVVETDEHGRSVAKFAGPFVAEGVTAAEAYAGLGEAGGAEPVQSDRVRLISRGPVEIVRSAGSSEVEIRAKTLNVLPLDDSGKPVRAVRIPEGVRVIPGDDGAWTFAFLAEHAAAIPLESSELEELAKLAEGR